MISAILSILGSSTVGTLLGGIFAFLNKKADLEVKKLELAHEVDKWSHELSVKEADLRYAQAEAAAKLQVAVVETDGAIETSRFAAIAAAQQADKITAAEIQAAGSLSWLLVIADAATRLIRPVSTLILAGAAIYINLLLVSKLGDGWAAYTKEQQFDAAMQAFAWITGQAGAVLAYWFVSRGAPRK